jgi:heme exporter protein C
MAQSDQHRTPKLLLSLVGACIVVLPAALYAIFVHAPLELQMGIAQKIFYFHVPCANAMYAGFILCAVGSAVYLAKRSERWDALALAAGEVGMLFFLCVVTTGPLWARKAWGVYWTWDPRLTTTLLGGLIFLAYLVLRSFGGSGEVEKRFAAGLAIVGVLNLPVIKYSVERWRGTHPTVISAKGGGIHDDMKPGLLLGFLLMLLLCAALIWLRTRGERLRQRLDALEMEAAQRGLLEET